MKRNSLLAAFVALQFILFAVRAEAQKVSPKRVLASVRIGAYGGCSGTIIAKDDTHAFGVSAAHCASRVGEQFTFGNPDGSTGAARWAAIDRSRDLALFICWTKDVLAACPVPLKSTPDFTGRIEAVGYPGGRGPKWKVLKYIGSHTIRSTNGTFHRDQFQNRGPGEFGGGDSGGGIFYDGDALIGVMTHGGVHAATHQQIIEFILANRAKLKDVQPFDCRDGRCDRPGWKPTPNIPVIPGDRPDWGDKDRTDKIVVLQKQITALQQRLEQLEKQKPEQGAVGPAGPQGPPGNDGRPGERGPQGPPGTITIVLIDEMGRELKRAAGVVSGSTVRLPVRRFLRDGGK